MPRITQEKLRKAQITLKKEKVFTLSRLISVLGCSSRTAKTKLKQWQTYTSYNQNNKYLRMPDIPQFNIHGLWHYKGKYFSKYGNMKETVVYLIRHSEFGLSGNQIGKLIGLKPQSFLHHFRFATGIRREKQEGVYIYFSAESDQYQKQVKKRLTAALIEVRYFTNAQSIAIFKAVIKHPLIAVEAILALPEVKTSNRTKKDIQVFLEYHGLKSNSGYKALKQFKTYVNKLISDVSVGTMFPQKPTIPFYPEIKCCPHCRGKLNVQKTQEKTVVTMDIGAFCAKETILECLSDQMTFVSQELRKLVPAQSTFGFDVIEYVGKALFLYCRNNQEIMQELRFKNIYVSERERGHLGRKFIVYLAIAHQESSKYLRQSMASNGGYILHVDGTCDGDSPHLFCGLDGISKWVLGSIKIPSENKDQLIPFFRNLKKQYGDPIALVHDMGTGILSAVEVVFPNILDYICHFHFLRDVGKDLMLKENQSIMKYLRKHNVRKLLRQKIRYLKEKLEAQSYPITHLSIYLEDGKLKPDFLESVPTAVTYVLIHWIFESASESCGYGFPFDRPHLDFYRRLKEVYHLFENIRDIYLRDNAFEVKVFARKNFNLKRIISLFYLSGSYLKRFFPTRN